MSNLRLAHDAQFQILRKDETIKQSNGSVAAVLLNGIYQEYKNVQCAIEAYNSIEREKAWKAEHAKRFAKKPRVRVKKEKLTDEEIEWRMFAKKHGIKL